LRGGPPAAEARQDPSTFSALDLHHVGDVASKTVESCGIIDQDGVAQGCVRNDEPGGLFIRERGFLWPQNKGRFNHDRRFNTLMDVVNSYDARFNLGLSDQEKLDPIEYLKWH
jgi:hypothetical protein